MATSDSIREYSFSFDEIMKEVQTINQLRVKEIYDKDNNVKFDDYAISDDDGDTVKIFVKNAVFDLVEISASLMSELTNAVKVDDPYGVMVKNNESVNESIKLAVKNSFKQVIVSSVLKQWYEMKGLAEDFKLWSMNLERLKEGDVKKRIFLLKLR